MSTRAPRPAPPSGCATTRQAHTVTGSTWPLAPRIAALVVALAVIVAAGKSLATTADTPR